MKKLSIVILAIIILLSACDSGEKTPVSSSSPPEISMPPVSSAPSEGPAVTASPEPWDTPPPEIETVYDKKEYTNAEKVVGKFNYSAPQFDAEFLSEADVLFNRGVMSVIDTLESSFSQRIDGEDSASGWYCDISSEIMYINNDVISLVMHIDRYTGGVHNSLEISSLTFERSEGRFLTLDDIFSVGSEIYLERIFGAITNQIEPNADNYYSNYTDRIRERFNPSGFYLTDGSLIIYYQEYDLAAYAVGYCEFEIPSSDISDIIETNFLEV